MPESVEVVEEGRLVVLAIRRRKLIRILGLITLGFWIAYVLALVAEFGFGHPSVFGLVQLFDLDREANPPTYFSATVLLMCALVLLWLAAQARARGDGRCGDWLLLSIIFLGLCADESARLHELAGDLIHRWWAGSGPWRSEWVILGMASVAVFAVRFLRFWWKLPGGTRWRMGVAGAVYVAGALGMEMVNATVSAPGRRQLHYAFCVLLEESLEMTGAILFLDALLRHIGPSAAQLLIREE